MRIALLLLTPLALSGCGSPDPYVSGIDEWHASRIERLRSDTGWLTLAGLHRLDPGTYTLGSGADNGIVMGEGAPMVVGTLTIGEGVRFTTDASVTVTDFNSGEVVSSVQMASDAGGSPTVLTDGRMLMHVIERGGALFLRVRDRQSETLAAFDGIDRFPVDPDLKTTAVLVGGPAGDTVGITNILGQVEQEPTPGVLEFSLAGETHQLRPTQNADGSLFIVFGDATNGHETYGAGRFLSADAPDDSGRVELDFNKAYNPVCALSPHATCPLPPAENRLGVRIEGGETYPARTRK